MSISQDQKEASGDKNVCLRLREAREGEKLTQKAVADQLGVSIKTVGRWERDTPIPSGKLALLRPLGIDVTYVLTGMRVRDDARQMMDMQTNLGAQAYYYQELAKELTTIGEERGFYRSDNPSAELLRLFEGATDAGRDAILATARAVEKIKK